ncbi:MAG: hypothetical protein WBP42_13080 [Candidatus Zixiibacteriota bacterium]
MSIRDRAIGHCLLLIFSFVILTSKLVVADPMSCTLANNNGSGYSFKSDNQVGDRTVIYFDFAACTGASSGYPYELLSATFSLTDVAGATWPAVVVLVVYDRAAMGHECHGPGLELCRFTVVCGRASYEYPNFGTFTLPTSCCLKGPFYVGIEYIEPVNAPYAHDCDCVIGDADDNTVRNISDVVFIITAIFAAGEYPARLCGGDADGACLVTISDAVYMVNYIFAGGPAPLQCELWEFGRGAAL